MFRDNYYIQDDNKWKKLKKKFADGLDVDTSSTILTIDRALPRGSGKFSTSLTTPLP